MSGANKEKIGSGSYSEVYKVLLRDAQTGKLDYAAEKISVRHNDSESQNGIPAYVLREVSLLRQLNHQNICFIRQVEVDPNGPSISILMDYYKYDLRKFYQSFVLNEKSIRQIAYECLRGLAYLHQNRVMHRDIKPNNILLNSEESVVISDFGFARKIDLFPGEYSNRVGTYAYRSPELILGAKSYSVAVDIWALGCTLIELVFKAQLFSGANDFAVLQTQIFYLGVEKFESSTDLDLSKLDLTDDEFRAKNSAEVLKSRLYAMISPEGAKLLLKMVEPSPAQRIQAKTALKDSWFQGLYPN